MVALMSLTELSGVLAFSLLKEKTFRVTTVTAAAHLRGPESSLLKTAGEILNLCLSPFVCSRSDVYLVKTIPIIF